LIRIDPLLTVDNPAPIPGCHAPEGCCAQWCGPLDLGRLITESPCLKPEFLSHQCLWSLSVLSRTTKLWVGSPVYLWQRFHQTMLRIFLQYSVDIRWLLRVAKPFFLRGKQASARGRADTHHETTTQERTWPRTKPRVVQLQSGVYQLYSTCRMRINRENTWWVLPNVAPCETRVPKWSAGTYMRVY
jgi:hypothetical protein